METVETYIVRIYQRDPKDLQKIAGLVETVGKNENKPFAGQEELWEILGCGVPGRRERAFRGLPAIKRGARP